MSTRASTASKAGRVAQWKSVGPRIQRLQVRVLPTAARFNVPGDRSSHGLVGYDVASTRRRSSVRIRVGVTFETRARTVSHGVVVSTQDPESCDRGSNPRRRSFELSFGRAARGAAVPRAAVECKHLPP